MASTKTAFSSTARRVWSRAQHWMEHHPVVSNSLLCLNLWVAGDVLAQYSEHRHHQKLLLQRHHTKGLKSDDNDDTQPQQQHESFQFDALRTAKCAGFGACFTGPLLAVWYPYLDRFCLQYKIAAKYGVWGPPIVKVWADEFLMDPPCIVTFFGYMAAWEHYQDKNGEWKDILKNKVEHQFMPSWIMSLTAWPPILLGTFRFLPVYAQAPVINVCCIVWDAFLSHRNALSKQEQDEEEEQSVVEDATTEKK